MDTKRTALVCAAAIALLVTAYFWSMGPGRSARSIEHGPEPLPSTSAPALPLDPPADRELVASTVTPVEDAEPDSLEPEQPPPPARPARPLTESTSRAAKEVLRLLKDEDFLDACADLENTATPMLEGLLTEARRAVSDLTGEEGILRAEAGLFEPIAGYKPGEPTNFHLNEGDLLQSIYSAGVGDANLVELPRAEYPELYALRDASKRFDAELRARARQAARSAVESTGR